MGLSYHFQFIAPQGRTASDLETFLRTIEAEAKALGFQPTLVLNAQFDTPERREFSKRLTKGLIVEDDNLKGVNLPAKAQIWDHDSSGGWCRVIPEQGVVLVVTDEKRRETIFGFFRYPSVLLDIHGNGIVSTGTSRDWIFSDFVNSPDPRFRQIVRRFADAGFLAQERDEFSDGHIMLPARPQETDRSC